MQKKDKFQPFRGQKEEKKKTTTREIEPAKYCNRRQRKTIQGESCEILLRGQVRGLRTFPRLG